MLTDEDLMVALRSGCNDALAVLFERHSALVQGKVRAILQDDRTAEDIVCKVFLDAFRAVNQFDPYPGNVQIMLLRCAYLRIMNCRRDLREAELEEFQLLEDEIIGKPIGKALTNIRIQTGLSIDEATEGVKATHIDRKQMSRALGLAIKQSREELRMSRRELSRKTGLPLGKIIELERGLADALPITEFIRISYALGISPEVLGDRFDEFHRNIRGGI
jgi:RNA polymerase sigma-70 factor (ECF subfamily)